MAAGRPLERSIGTLMTIAENIARIRANMAAAAREAGRDPADITLEAATKVQTSDTIRQAIAAGITVCGENRVQEMNAHLDDYAYDGAALHFIGHLQTNKVKQVVGKAALIHSVDSQRLLQAIGSQAASWAWCRTSCWRSTSPGGEQGAAPAGGGGAGRPGGGDGPCAPAGLMAIPPVARRPEDSLPYFSAMRQLFVDIRGKNVG